MGVATFDQLLTKQGRAPLKKLLDIITMEPSPEAVKTDIYENRRLFTPTPYQVRPLVCISAHKHSQRPATLWDNKPGHCLKCRPERCGPHA